MSEQEFYVGYEPRAPARLGRFLRKTVGLLVLGGVVVGAGLAVLQQPFDPGTFEFGVLRNFAGVLSEQPVPTLLVDRPGLPADGQPVSSRFLLVAPGKFGALDLVEGMDGQRIRAKGSLIFRSGETMIELQPGSVEKIPSGSKPKPPFLIDLGHHTLVGEIVDSKCYLGVMKPGRRKTHRACAARCISGGIPPILRVGSSGDEPLHVLLVGHDGAPLNQQILDRVAEPVEVSGKIRSLGSQLVVYAEPGAIRRVER